MTNYISTPLSTLNEDLNSVQTALSSKADKTELTAYAQLSDIPDITVGEYLPLSGGNLNGRIYLATQSSITSLTGTGSGTFEYFDETYGYSITAWLIDEQHPTPQFAITSPDVFPWIEKNFTVSQSGNWTVYSWSGEVTQQVMDFEDVAGSFQISVMGSVVSYTGDFQMGSEEGGDETHFFPSFSWTQSGGGQTTDAFVLSSELTTAIGDINSILDSINGQVI